MKAEEELFERFKNAQKIPLNPEIESRVFETIQPKLVQNRFRLIAAAASLVFLIGANGLALYFNHANEETESTFSSMYHENNQEAS